MGGKYGIFAAGGGLCAHTRKKIWVATDSSGQSNFQKSIFSNSSKNLSQRWYQRPLYLNLLDSLACLPNSVSKIVEYTFADIKAMNDKK